MKNLNQENVTKQEDAIEQADQVSAIESSLCRISVMPDGTSKNNLISDTIGEILENIEEEKFSDLIILVNWISNTDFRALEVNNIKSAVEEYAQKDELDISEFIEKLEKVELEIAAKKKIAEENVSKSSESKESGHSLVRQESQLERRIKFTENKIKIFRATSLVENLTKTNSAGEYPSEVSTQIDEEVESPVENGKRERDESADEVGQGDAKIAKPSESPEAPALVSVLKQSAVTQVQGMGIVN